MARGEFAKDHGGLKYALSLLRGRYEEHICSSELSWIVASIPQALFDQVEQHFQAAY